MDIVLQPVAFVKNTRNDLSDDLWGSIVSEIELAGRIPADAFNGIEEFSHLEIFFPFLPDRPNSIGATIVELVKTEGNRIWVKTFDAIDSTPILDIKPVLREFLPSGEIRQPKWSSELVKDYWK